MKGKKSKTIKYLTGLREKRSNLKMIYEQVKLIKSPVFKKKSIKCIFVQISTHDLDNITSIISLKSFCFVNNLEFCFFDITIQLIIKLFTKSIFLLESTESFE